MGWYLFTDPLFYVRQAVIVTAVAGLCLVAIWAGLSRRHWFVRAAAVWAGIAALLPIRAHVPARMFLFVLPTVAVVILAIRRWLIPPTELRPPSEHVRAGWMRYGLRDLFLAVLLTGAILATGMAAWRPHGQYWTWWLLASGGCLALLAVLSTVAVLVPTCRRKGSGVVFGHTGNDMAKRTTENDSRPRRGDAGKLFGNALLWLLALGASVAGTAALHTGIVPDCFFFWGGLDFPSLVTRVEWLLALALAFSEFTGLIVLTLALGRSASGKTPVAQQSRRQAVARGLLVVETLVLFLPLAVFYGHMLHRPRLPDVRYPRENNYPQLLAAAEKLTSLNGAQLTVADLQSQGASAAIAKQVAELHTALLAMVAQPGYVPFDPAKDAFGEYTATSMPHIWAFRSVTWMWQKEGEAAAKARRFDEASRYGIACMQSGNTLSRGGSLTHAVAGIALEGIGVDILGRIRGELTPAQTHAVVADLDQIEQAREPVAVTLARDAVWNDEPFGWAARFPRATAKLIGKQYQTESLVRRVFDQRDACLRLLRTDLALRLFRQDCGRLPERLDELVPKYLAATPVDPFSNQPLVYRRGDTGYLLYSVGPDGEDNGGHFGSHGDLLTRGYDMDLDALGRQPGQR
jgi:hypothetical protein